MLGVGSLAQMVAAVAFFPGLAAIAPALQGFYRINLLQIGALFSAIQLGPALSILIWGLVADRWGDRVALAAGLGGAAVALIAVAETTAYVAGLGLLMVASMLASSAAVASARVATTWFGAHERALAMSIRQVSLPIGGALAGVLLPAMAAGLGIARMFLALAGACGLTALLGLSGVARRVAATPRAGVGLAPIRDRRLWRLAAGCGLLVLGQNSLTAYMVLFLTEYRRLPLHVAGLVFLTAQLAGAGTRLVAGGLSDRLGTRVRPIRWVAIGLALALAGVAIGVDLVPTVLAPLLVVAAVLSMSSNAIAYTASAEIAGAERAGAAIGFQITALSFAGMVAPLGFGAIASALGWRSAFAVIAACAALAWIVLQPLAGLERRRWAGAPAAG